MIKKYNKVINIEEEAEHFVTSINSYLGFMKNYNTYAIRRNIIKSIDEKWWKVLYVENDPFQME